MKGTDLLATAKNQLKMTIKFIITDYPSAEIGAKVSDYGEDTFILRPVRMSELLSIINPLVTLKKIPIVGKEKISLSETKIGLTL